MTKIRKKSSSATNLATVATEHMSLTLFGKVVDGIERISTTGALEHPESANKSLLLGQVFGYSEHQQCVRLPKPALILVPEPAGPANTCGWDPAEFVRWEVPFDWATLLLHPVAGPIRESLRLHSSLSNTVAHFATRDQSLGDWQCDRICSGSVRSITKSTRPYNRSDSLQQYGVNSDAACRAIADVVVGDAQLGVGQFTFKLEESAIADLSPSWTMGQLATRIKSKAVPT